MSEALQWLVAFLIAPQLVIVCGLLIRPGHRTPPTKPYPVTYNRG